MKKPIIGISGSIMTDDGGAFSGYERAYVNNDYIHAVIKAGGIPYIIPLNCNLTVIQEQIKNVDGIIMSGGHDVNPLLFGEEPEKELGDILPKRDLFDTEVIKIAMRLKKPILAICRGHQILNVANGGTLYQDLKFINNCHLKHNQKKLPHTPTHTILIEENSHLYEILGNSSLTNSFHHLAIKDIAPNFKATAFSKDGVIEAIEHISAPFIVGVQWHPEMLVETDNKMLKLFEKLIEFSK